ncbi:8117_t:CDS:10 [Diversispora eburnea]|uniref:Signal recognition particle subunit SRP68 n=1 Tax=Diversispora eburnea TaxID=1213867 RepID=A0A9N8WG22_9GLOM|nr:8117_t:CDS:10 [Diversispora eburnea]
MDNMEVDDSAKEQETAFSLDILSLINEARNTYGLRHQDYNRYRQYCMKKIYRLRVSLNFTHSKGRFTNFKEITVDILNDIRYLHIALFDAERAWSYAMELKRESLSTGDTRKKHHLINRLKKADKLSTQLEKLCSREAGKAYSALMSGYLLFEKQSFQAALDKFAAARTIYEKLSSAGTPHQETLCQSAIDDIDPNIRYCAYKLRIGTDSVSDVEDLVKTTIKKNKGVGLDLLEAEVESVLAQNRQVKAASITSISWRGHIIPLKNADLAICILKTREASTKLEEALNTNAEEATKMEMFDSLLEAYGDAERFAKNALKEDASEQISADLNYVYNYVSYNYLCRRIQRNLMLVDSLKKQLEAQKSSDDVGFISGKYQDIVKLYDNVLQSLNEISELSEVQNNLPLSQEVEAKIWFFKAWRTLYVASAYAILNKELEAILLYERANEYNLQAKTSLSNLTPDKEDILIISKENVDNLESLLRSHKVKAHAALNFYHSGDDSDITEKMNELGIDEEKSKARNKKDEMPLIEHLNQYPLNLSINNVNLINFPPEFTAIPAKPLFFDIASNYINYPSNLSQRAGHKQGILGFFGGFWGSRRNNSF